jgi:hypothetical protein
MRTLSCTYLLAILHLNGIATHEGYQFVDQIPPESFDTDNIHALLQIGWRFF